jgi:hypothetical protein
VGYCLTCGCVLYLYHGIVMENAMPKQDDDFQRAAANARAEAGDYWLGMPAREQAQAIYAQLRQIDTLRVLTMKPESQGSMVPSGVRRRF